MFEIDTTGEPAKPNRNWGGARAGAGRPRKPAPPTPPSAADRFAALFADQADSPIIQDDEGDTAAISDADEI